MQSCLRCQNIDMCQENFGSFFYQSYDEMYYWDCVWNKIQIENIWILDVMRFKGRLRIVNVVKVLCMDKDFKWKQNELWCIWYVSISWVGKYLTFVWC